MTTETPDPTPPNPWKLTDGEGRELLLVGDPRYSEPVPDTRCHPPQLLLSPELLAELWRMARGNL